ncbi:MAG: AbrB/MazE/SpoVT family DNA-binding domain-containing protein [Candidatus Woesearchaeota archaeon]
MKRKIIQQAKQAYTITLPIEWIKNSKLKAGDEIDIAIDGKDLIIKTDNRQVGGEIKIDAKEMDARLINNYLSAAYAGGFDQVDINCSSNEISDLNQMIGYAVINQRKDSCTIKDISGSTFENLEEIFKQVFQSVISYYEFAIEDISKDRKGNTLSIRKKDDDINKYTFFLQRSMIKKGYTDSVLRKIMFTYAFELEKIGDSIFRIWDSELKEKQSDNLTIEILTISKQCLEKAFAIFYQTSTKNIKELLVLRDKLKDKTELSLKKYKNSRKATIYALSIVEDCVDLTHLSLMYRQKINNIQIKK